MVGGDFNMVKYPYEKNWGGRSSTSHSTKLYFLSSSMIMVWLICPASQMKTHTNGPTMESQSMHHTKKKRREKCQLKEIGGGEKNMQSDNPLPFLFLVFLS